MKKIYLVLLILLPTFISGQETIKKTKSHSNPNYKEVYYVLKSDKSTLHGSYKKLSAGNDLLVYGFYKNGTKDSIWTEYSWSRQLIKSGKYMNGKRVGLWEFYNHESKLEQSFDYSTNELVYYKISDKEKNKKFNVINNGGINKLKLDRPPLYLEGSMDINSFIVSNTHQPIQAMEKGISGKVEITFTIDSEGRTSNHRVTKGIGWGCDEEALRVVKLIPDEWLPGILDGKAVSVEYTLSINFRVY